MTVAAPRGATNANTLDRFCKTAKESPPTSVRTHVQTSRTRSCHYHPSVLTSCAWVRLQVVIYCLLCLLRDRFCNASNHNGDAACVGCAMHRALGWTHRQQQHLGSLQQRPAQTPYSDASHLNRHPGTRLLCRAGQVGVGCPSISRLGYQTLHRFYALTKPCSAC